MVTTLAMLAALLDTEPTVNLATPDSWTGSMQGGVYMVLLIILVWAVISIENSRNRNKKDK